MVARAGKAGPLTEGGEGLLAFAGLAALPGVRHFVTTRALGDLKTEAARGRLAAALGVAADRLIRGRQVHGVEAALAAPGSPGVLGDAAAGADIVLAAAPGLAIATLCADCAPVALVDPAARAIAVAHAGWRGAVAGVASRAARLLVERLGADPRRIRAAIGPCIGPCCYEVGAEVLAAARARPGGAAAIAPGTAPGRAHLDLAALVAADLEAAGVAPWAIERAGVCTRCAGDRFFSHRGSGTAERFGLAVALAE
jgi:YfiH family protein